MKLVSDSLIITTYGDEVMSDKQAEYFAISIFADIKAYIKDHRTEFEEWQEKQGGDAVG